VKIAGIDLAGSNKRNTGVCILNEKLKAVCFSVKKDKEIVEIVENANPAIIAIDAPLSLPSGRKSLRKSKIHFRQCDKELWKLGIKFFPITLGPMRLLTKRGIKLKKMLEEKKFRVIEVYPGATQDMLGIPRKQAGLKKLLLGLKKIGIKNLRKNLNGDELDAVTAAYTGFLYLNGNYAAAGNKKEGQIILPSKPFCVKRLGHPKTRI